MPQIIPATFRKTFVNIEKEKAYVAAQKFAESGFTPGYEGRWEVAMRADSPTGHRVNLYVYSMRKGKK
jgi:hypothetical protein